MLALARGLYLISLIGWGVSKLVVFCVFLLFFSLLALYTSCMLLGVIFCFLNKIAFNYKKKKKKKKKTTIIPYIIHLLI